MNNKINKLSQTFLLNCNYTGRNRMSSNPVIRRAVSADYTDLMDIGDVYGGIDYFMALYHDFLDDPDIYPVVAEVKCRAIGFSMNHIIDGGLTVSRRAGRVHNSHRGAGIMHLMTQELERHQRENYPGVKYLAWCARRSAAEKAGRDMRDNGYEKVILKPTLGFIFDVKKIKCHLKPEITSQVLSMTYDDLNHLFGVGDVVDALFPKKRLFNFYKPFRCMEANIKHVISERHDVFATTSAPTAQISEGQGHFTEEMLRDIDMVSFSERFPVRHGLVYTLDLYGRDQVGDVTIRSHLQRHVGSLETLTQDGGTLVITYGNNIEGERVFSILRELGVDELSPVVDSWKVLYEKCVDTHSASS
ncbi:histidine N-acetyltransferase-like [Physella acuta]|uniref:histidine N-acetyltransferase-like n=1 Tax=Physella acuta TaxID=109671 RepID=UPI0027DD6DC5|nr:histidine N-acetyltransferase-like [Physella acuta]